MKKVLLFTSLTLLLIGCNSLKVQNMIVQDETFVFKPTGKIVMVHTIEDFKAKIINAEQFNEALIQSIINSGLFKVNSSNYDYEITANMTHWFQPPFSTTFHTDLIVEYTVKNKEKVVFQKSFESNSVARMKDAIVGVKRSKISFERAMKKNIEMFLTEISQVYFE